MEIGSNVLYPLSMMNLCMKRAVLRFSCDDNLLPDGFAKRMGVIRGALHGTILRGNEAKIASARGRHEL
jgi:hypothetical protein